MAGSAAIGIFGAGAIGVYVGGRLIAAGSAVRFVGRPAMGKDVSSGLELTSFDGSRSRVDGARIEFSDDPATLSDCDIVLVCVKSTDTDAAARALGPHIAPGACVVSLQNGVGNAARLRAGLPGRAVLAGMVAFNVARIGAARFHQGTEGGLHLEAGGCAEKLSRRLNAAGLETKIEADIDSVLWSKLLLNLNNAVNALSGLPLKQQLSMRAHRLPLADCIAEGLAALKVAGIRPARITKVPPQWLPAILRLPDFLFVRLAAAMLRMDDDARSSMAQDLERGRKPEVDYLNGEIIRLGDKFGVPTPANRRVRDEILARFAKVTV
jgi:2-dehydropantoate 2-reductase